MSGDDKKQATKNGTAAWMLPYLAISASLLGLLSWLVGSYLLPQIPLWGHAVAIAAALSILAVTLYALSSVGVAGGSETNEEGQGR